MSILRIATGPADVGLGGYTFESADVRRFDPKRVLGCFSLYAGDALLIPHPAPSGTTTWYHFRLAQTTGFASLFDSDCLRIADSNSQLVAVLNVSAGQFRISANGATTVLSGRQALAMNTTYSMDIQVIVAATITVRWYINGALYAEVIAANTGTVRGVSRSATMYSSDGDGAFYFSEFLVADEDTRGMRVREMRPKSFGIFQEWDGSVTALRDADLATGISTPTADRRVSFGVTNIENIQPGDVINRVVAQSFAQKGESGLSAFNHFFRHKNSNVTDGADLTLSVLGGYFLEEFPINPDTGVGWLPEDFASLQTGVRSRA